MATSTDKCRLCLAQADLVQSHVIPEWCYRPAYDDKHRARVHTTDLSPPKSGESLFASRFIQKGFRERLLCQDCESKLSAWERWFADFWNHAPGLPSSLADKTLGEFYEMDGVDYEPFKLFHLSIVWRASVAKRGEFDNVALGPYEEKLRRMLLAGDPGPEDCYPLFGTLLTTSDESRSVMPGLVSKPQRARVSRTTIYYAAYAGCEWTLAIVDRAGKLSGDLAIVFRELTARKGEKLRLWVRPLIESNTVKLWCEQAGAAAQAPVFPQLNQG